MERDLSAIPPHRVQTMKGLGKLASCLSSLPSISSDIGNKQERENFFEALRQVMQEKKISGSALHGEVIGSLEHEILDEVTDEVFVITTEWRVSIKP